MRWRHHLADAQDDIVLSEPTVFGAAVTHLFRYARLSEARSVGFIQLVSVLVLYSQEVQEKLQRSLKLDCHADQILR